MNFTNNISFASLAKWHVQLIDWKQENIQLRHLRQANLVASE